MPDLPHPLEIGLAVLLVAALAIGLALLLHRMLFAALERIARRARGLIGRSLLVRARQPARSIFALAALLLALPTVGMGVGSETGIQRLLTVALTIAIGWLSFNLTKSINDVVAARYDIGAVDNLVARQIHTRVLLLQRILASVVVVITACVALMAIPAVRQIGVAVFASAGVAGIIAGLAARSTLANLFAGIQVALTQPIRIEDAVIVEGEFGWVEEIRMSYVIVRLWDLRRLIVPLSWFIEKPFQNWTRQTASLLGAVYLYVDYTVPVERVRQELRRILQDSDLWDGQAGQLQVSNASERTVELRALMGARNAGDAWGLRCEVREKLVDFLQREYPDALPRLRAELPPEDRAQTGDGRGGKFARSSVTNRR